MTDRKDTLTIRDNRTGKAIEIPIQYGTYPDRSAGIPAGELRKLKVSEDDFGLMCYDPAFSNTASCRSRITFLDGERGILRYRGYPIEELATHSTFLETAYLLIHGELPSRAELKAWTGDVLSHAFIHENLKKFIDGFRHDAHPMGILVGTVAGLSTFYPEAKKIRDPAERRRHMVRVLAKMPTLAAFAYRHAAGLPYVYPGDDLSYAGNLLNMMFNVGDHGYRPDPVFERVLDSLFVLHADNEQNCSTTAVRGIGSSHADPYSAIAGGCAALYGQLQGSADEGVVRMLTQIGSRDRVPDFIRRVKTGEELLWGFGHRVYRNYDPRAKIVRKLADEVFEVTGKNPLLDIALEIERLALNDDYFVSRRLFPTVHFYSGLIYQSMGFPVSMIPVLFAIGRTPGWLAQWEEMLTDAEQKIARPRQVYTGPDQRSYVPIGERRGG
ncbi:MAG: citrate synthase [Nitrospirae bacterium]|nr:citrate synthase [Nitrospirota bacterium]